MQTGPIFKNKSKKRNVQTTHRFVPLKIILVIFASVPPLMFLWWMTNGHHYQEQEENKKRLFGEFSLDNNTIYVAIPSNGDYPIPQADIKSFHSISDKYYDGHIGVDKNNVYCGNRIIPSMKPNTVKPLGNNYYSDGKTTYFCNRGSQRNTDLKWYKETYQIIRHEFFNGEKPQNYLYEMKALPQSKTPYYSLEKVRKVVTNGEKAYYKAKLMPQANPKKLQQMKSYHFDLGNQWRTSNVYASDGKNVYFKNYLLPLSDNEGLYSIEGKFNSHNSYLIDPRDGMVYVDKIPFDKQNTPYVLISESDSHTYHTLWLSKNGLFFYHTETKEVQRAGDNPFLDKGFKEIAPLVFSNGEETLFIDTYEIWNNSRTDKSLKSRHTTINRLDNLDKNTNWEKLGDVSIAGSVWQHGKDFYYFDKFGLGQLIHHTIYKIKDGETTEKLIEKENYTGISRYINKLVDDGKLILPSHTEILQAKTEYDYSDKKLKVLACFIIAILFALIRFAKKRQSHFSNRKKNEKINLH